jgi:hypothetical protein
VASLSETTAAYLAELGTDEPPAEAKVPTHG